MYYMFPKINSNNNFYLIFFRKLFGDINDKH